jgi:LmbE family N-acetylglucosaminyl deacetylase
VRKILKEQDAEVVFCLPGNDAHPTHSTASRIVQEAIRGTGVREVWFYETWTPLEAPNFIHFFGEEEMNAKEMAIRKHGSQVKRMDLVGAFTGLSAYRGTMGRPLMEGFGKSRMARKRYGEAFLVMRREPDKG